MSCNFPGNPHCGCGKAGCALHARRANYKGPEDNCSEELKQSIPEEKRKLHAARFGENWASIISGLGDQ